MPEADAPVTGYIRDPNGEWIAQRGNTADAAEADAVQFVRGDPSTVTVGSTYTLPPHNEPHVVLLIVDEGVVVHHAWSPCVVVHLAPLGSGPSGSAATVKKGMNWFASSASPVKLTDEERVRADAARERFTQGEQRMESRRQAERERHAAHAAVVADARQREQEAQRARRHAEAAEAHRNSFCCPRIWYFCECFGDGDCFYLLTE